MSRLLFWLALAVLVVYAIRSKARQSRPPRASARPKPEHVTEAEAMSCCAHCGMYFPASEAVRADGLDYCSPAHVRLPAK